MIAWLQITLTKAHLHFIEYKVVTAALKRLVYNSSNKWRKQKDRAAAKYSAVFLRFTNTLSK